MVGIYGGLLMPVPCSCLSSFSPFVFQAYLLPGLDRFDLSSIRGIGQAEPKYRPRWTSSLSRSALISSPLGSQAFAADPARLRGKPGACEQLVYRPIFSLVPDGVVAAWRRGRMA